jgi:hypothetical protein
LVLSTNSLYSHAACTSNPENLRKDSTHFKIDMETDIRHCVDKWENSAGKHLMKFHVFYYYNDSRLTTTEALGGGIYQEEEDTYVRKFPLSSLKGSIKKVKVKAYVKRENSGNYTWISTRTEYN